VRYDAALVVMHTKALPKQRLQRRDLYDDVTGEVLAFLTDRLERAVAGGLPRESLIVDPGPDFAKTPHQTISMLRRLPEIRALGRPVLLALSRKDFLGAILERSPQGRAAGTIAAIAYLTADTPGSIVRVHDVAATRDALRTIDVLAGRAEVDPDYVLADSIRYEPKG
jgi:dihydropteroate synthase